MKGDIDVAAIRAAYPIEQVVADSGVTLRPAGHGFLGCCPFHDDSTASLSVGGRPDRYHCFGCGASGDVIDYIARLHHLGFRDAIAHLTGMPPTRHQRVMSPGRGAPGARGRGHETSSVPGQLSREGAFEINRVAWDHYSEPVRHAFATRWLTRRRRIDLTALEQRLAAPVVGMAGAGWTDLVETMRRRGVSDEELLALDLARVSARGQLVDTLRNRIVVPVHDGDTPGGITGFIGRDISGHPQAPKYRNPTRTVVFDKSTMTYQPDGAGQRAAAQAPVIVVEGPLDALAIAATAATTGRPDLATVVSLAGTTVSPTQAHRVHALAAAADAPLVIALDGDPAGANGTRTWIDTLRTLDPATLRRVLVAHLPPGADPADLLARHGPAALHTVDPSHLGQTGAPTPPGAELVALTLTAHTHTHAHHTGSDLTPAVIEALRPLATTLPARHTALLLATATHEMTRAGWNPDHAFTRALHATGWLPPTRPSPRADAHEPRPAPVLALP